MEEYSSSHAIVRALKGPSDPPIPGGISKIEIARKTWDSKDIHFPNKEEVLVEWILSSFLKDKASTRLIISTSHWTLLGDILEATSQAKAARPGRVWLLVLLNRLSIASITSSFFISVCSGDARSDAQLREAFARCMHILWPIGVARISLDTLADCFESICNYLSSNPSKEADVSTEQIVVLVIQSLRQSFGNASNKKKTVTTFMQNHAKLWIQYLSSAKAAPSNKLSKDNPVYSELWHAGVDILFSADALKSSQNPLTSLLELFAPPNTHYLCILPNIYQAYVEETRKHRFTIFGSGSSHAQDQAVAAKVKDANMRAFVAIYNVVSAFGEDAVVWETILALLNVLEGAKVVDFNFAGDAHVLGEVASRAVNALSQARGETALRVLCVLTQIHFETVEPLIPQILSALKTTSQALQSDSQALLRSLLEFYSKTRTIPSYISALTVCLSRESFTGSLLDGQNIYYASTSGVLLSIGHIEYISRVVKTYVTPGQVLETIQILLDALKSAWNTYSDSFIDGMDVDQAKTPQKSRSKKKQRTENSDRPLSDTRAESSAISFALTARIVSAVLPSLPFSSLHPSSLSSARDLVSTAWKDFLFDAASSHLSVKNPPDWLQQTTRAASLRIRHALLSSSAVRLLGISSTDFEISSNIAGVISSSSTLPELVIELLRSFFDHELYLSEHEERSSIIDAMLDYLLLHTNPDSTSLPYHFERSWNGSSGTLSILESGSAYRSALTVLHLVLDRWLLVIEELASTDQLSRLAELLITIMSHSYARDHTSPSLVTSEYDVERAMHSAEFWELSRLRDALVPVMDKVFNTLHWRDFSKLTKAILSGSKKQTVILDIHSILSVGSVYELLLRAPKEYLPKSYRITFFRQGLVADMIVWRSIGNLSQADKGKAHRVRAIIRSWLCSTSGIITLLDIIAEPEEYLEYLTSPDFYLETNNDESLKEATLNLLDNIQRHMIRTVGNGENDCIQRLCSFHQKSLTPEKVGSPGLRKECLVRFVELLVIEGVSADKLLPASRLAIDTLQKRLIEAFSTTISSIKTDSDLLTLGLTATQAWKASLCLKKWLSTEGDVKFYGKCLLMILVGNRESPEIAKHASSLGLQIFALLLEELHFKVSSDREAHLELVFYTYVFLSASFYTPGYDSTLTRATRLFSVSDSSSILNLIRCAIAKEYKSSQEFRNIIHLSAILVSNAPEGASKITQQHFEDSLQRFVAKDIFISGDADLVLEVLSFINVQCTEKPASVKHVSIGLIWLFLTKILLASSIHTQVTHTRILHFITNVASTLVRLRRDLVTSTLPSFSMVLRLLLLALRTIRPQLGGKQTKQVSYTLPYWLNPAMPLGVEEARAVGRLLTSIQAKTVPRTFKEKNKVKDKEHAESLVQAFSKHAPFVLLAYIEAVNDPLCILPLSIRKELDPGLYVLCDVMGDHGRDALMVSALDAGGKAVLKKLWGEYVKQKYVGKG